MPIVFIEISFLYYKTYISSFTFWFTICLGLAAFSIPFFLVFGSDRKQYI